MAFLNHQYIPVFSILLIFVYFSLFSCTNDSLGPADDDMLMPTDTMDVEPMDTIAGVVCHPDSLYFELEVLPIFKSSCGRRDCHDAAKVSAGFKAETFESITQTGGIVPFMPEEARIFRQIIHEEEDERMPPPPYDRLSERQVNIIEEWINRGAKNYRCDSSTIPCETDSVSFSSDIAPLIKDACYGCHNQYVHEDDIELLDYEDIQAVALSGKLVGTVTGQGYVRMPFGSIPLSACRVEKIKAWVEAGALDN